jgi:hypothetical protein
MIQALSAIALLLLLVYRAWRKVSAPPAAGSESDVSAVLR